MAAAVRMDDLVKDYLLYRGLTSTFKSYDSELRNEKDKGFCAEKVVEQLVSYVSSHDVVGLKDYWSFLDKRLFRRLEHQYMGAVRKLEASLLKYYIVYALQNNRQEKVLDCFEKLGADLQLQSEWKEWFALPFIKNPEDTTPFSMYFSRQWQDTFLLSLHNFLSVVIQTMPVPVLMRHDDDKRLITQLRESNDHLKAQVQSLIENRPSACVMTPTTPSAPTPTLNCTDLMDDFYVISQDTTLPDRRSGSQAPPKTNQIKSFIKNIGLQSSPIMGKKSAPTLRKPLDMPAPSAPSAASGNLDSSGGSRTDQHSASIPSSGGSHSSATNQSTDGSTIATADPTGHIPSSFTLPNLSKTTQESSVSADINEEKAGYLLLSQEEYNEHHSSITHCRFSNTGHMVATADVDGVVKLWSLQPSPVTLATIMLKSMLVSLEWAGSGDRLLLMGSKSGTIRLFDVKEKKTIKEASVDPVYPRLVCLSCSPTGSTFVCSSASKIRSSMIGTAESVVPRQGRLTVCDLKSMKAEGTLPLGLSQVAVNCANFNHNGQLLVTGTLDGTIQIFDMQKCSNLASWNAHHAEVYVVQFSHDETSCYSMGSDSKFIQWSVHQTGKRLANLPIHNGACGPFILNGAGGYRQVQTPKGKLFAFDAEGHHVLTCASQGGYIYKVDKDSGLTRAMDLGGHKSPVVGVDWSTAIDCRMCITGSMDGKVRVSTLLAQ